MPTRSPLFLDAIAQDPAGPSVLGKRLPLGLVAAGAALLFAVPLAFSFGLLGRAPEPIKPVNAVFVPRVNHDQQCRAIDRRIELVRVHERHARCPRQRAYLQQQIDGLIYEMETRHCTPGDPAPQAPDYTLRK